MIAAGTSDAALAFIEIGAIVLGLGVAVPARRPAWGSPPSRCTSLAGLALGDGGIVQLDVTEDFIALAAEIGVLLLLFALGLEYSDSELRSGLRTGPRPAWSTWRSTRSPGLVVGLAAGMGPARRGAAGRRHVGHVVGRGRRRCCPTSVGSATGRRPPCSTCS